MVVKTLLKGAARTVAQKAADKLRTAEHLNYKGRPARLNQFGAGVRSGVISKGRDKRQQISDQIKKVHELKKNRDNNNVESKLSELNTAANSNDNLMPYIINVCVR